MDFAETALYFEMLFNIGVVDGAIYSQYENFIEDLKNVGIHHNAYTEDFIRRRIISMNMIFDHVSPIGRDFPIEQMRAIRQGILQTLSRESGVSFENLDLEVKQRAAVEFSDFIAAHYKKG